MLPASFAHSARGFMPLTFMLCQGQAETHGEATELGRQESSAVAALFLACVQVCVHLAPARSLSPSLPRSGVPVCLVLLSSLHLSQSQPTSLHVPVCVGFKASVYLPVSLPVWSVGFPPLHPLTNRLPPADRMCAML